MVNGLLGRTITFRKTPGIPCVSSAVWMAGLHLVIQMSKFRAPYLVRKRGIFYLQKCIPQQLTGHYGRTFVRKSLRTKDRLELSLIHI